MNEKYHANRPTVFCGDHVYSFCNEVIELTQANHSGRSIRFTDGEASVQVTGSINNIVIALQSVVNDKALMALLTIIDSLKRYGVKYIIGAITYLGYARQDRKIDACSPISARLIANLLETAGLDRLIVIDLHSELIEGFFSIPVSNLTPTEVFAEDIQLQSNSNSLDDIVIVAPDIGAATRARKLAYALGKTNIAIIDKFRPKAGISEVMNVIGEVENKHCILTDDIVDSAGTLCNAATALKNKGAKSVDAYVTHGIFAGKASDKTIDTAIIRISESELNNMVITNSVNYRTGINMQYYSHMTQKNITCEKIRVISISQLIANEIRKY